MKLAEALQLRSDLQKRIYQLQERLNQNATVQEGEKPAEDPVALLGELDSCIVQLEEMMERINRTNSVVTDQGETLTALLARRDCLTRRLQMMRNFLNSASSLVSRSSRSEIRIRSTVPVAKLQKDVDGLSKELRELDARIQGLNWTAELL